MDGYLVSLRLGTTRGPLTLRRLPQFMRFTIIGTDWTTLDALDQLDDQPKPDEHLIAAEQRGGIGSVHLDRHIRGRRVGEWYKTATYEPVEPQPPQEVMRHIETWQAWCLEQAERKHVPQPESEASDGT